MHHSSIRSAVRTAENAKKFKAQLVFRITMQLIFNSCRSFTPFPLFSLSLSVYVSVKKCIYRVNIRVIASNQMIMAQNIAELLQQIRQVENEHNQYVDEYFQISMLTSNGENISHFAYFLEEYVKQALTELNHSPTSNNLNTYNTYLILSESIMKNIRSKR